MKSIAPILVVLFAFLAGCPSKEERISSITAKIEKLEQRLAKAAAGRELLDGVEVIESEFEGRVENRAGTARFKVTVENNTQHMINRIEFDAVLTQPGSSEPLLRGKVDSGLPGSVSPGKRLSFVMYPMPGSSWDALDSPSDAILDLTPIRLSSIGIRNIAEARSPERTSRDEAKLASLRAELAD
jgi:hypothetical protein